MTSPRSTYGGYYSAPSFPDTPIYDSLVAERGTPQIAPIRASSPYDSGSNLPALPAARPALPAAPSPQYPSYGYPHPAPQPAPLQQAPAPYIPQQAPAPYIPQQATASRGYPSAQSYPAPPVAAGYDQMRPATPRPAPPRPAPAPYEDPYGHQQYPGPSRGY